MATVSVIYDLCCPSPLPLKETSSMAIALEVWRTEIREHRKNDTLGQIPLLNVDLLSRYQLRAAPSRVVLSVKKYLKEIGSSMHEWMEVHKAIFSQPDLLARFDDFVCDFDGTIDSDRTAKQIIHCDGIPLMVRFEMACVYCLEEDILRMWPEVSLIAPLQCDDELNSDNPQLFYWMCRLRNHFYKFSHTDGRELIMKDVFSEFVSKNPSWSLFKYFSDFLDLQTRLSVIRSKHGCLKIVCRHFLVVFSDEQIQKLVDVKGDKIVFWLVSQGEAYAMPVWTHFKSKMNSDVFKRLVRSMLAKGCGEGFYSGRDNNSLVEIWSTAPDHLRNAAVPDLLIENSLSLNLFYNNEWNHNYLRLLEAMLLNTPTEDRKTFWNNQWTRFIRYVDTKDVEYFMKLCLKDDCETDEFKQRVLFFQDQLALSRCFELIQFSNFQELLAFSKYWNFSKVTIEKARSRLLLEAMGRSKVFQPSSLNKFIEYSYNGDTTLANKFKEQLLLSPGTWNELSKCLNNTGVFHLNHSFWLVMNFVDKLAPSRKVIANLKKTRIVPFVKDYVRQNAFSIFTSYHLPIFIKWSFETDEKLADFKKTLDVDRIIEGLIQKETGDFEQNWYRSVGVDDCTALGCHIRMPHTSEYFLEDFLRWLTGSCEAVEELKRRYEGDDVFVKLMKVSNLDTLSLGLSCFDRGNEV